MLYPAKKHFCRTPAEKNGLTIPANDAIFSSGNHQPESFFTVAKTKTVDLFSYTKAECCIRTVDKGSIAWDYGRKAMFPLWPEHILYQHWYAPEGYYHHEHPTTWGFELPFSGNLQVSIDGAEPLVVEPGSFLLHPAATPNTLRTGPAGFCDKVSFGLCGTFLTAFMANSAIRPSRTIQLPDPGSVFRILEQLFQLMKPHNPEYAPKIAGLTLELLLQLEAAAKRPLPEPLGDAVYILESQIRYPYKISELEKELNISKSKLLKLFRTHFQLTPKQFYRKRKMEHAAHLLRTTELTIKDISAEVGYPDQLTFSHEFKKHCTLSPLEYRKSKPQE